MTTLEKLVLVEIKDVKLLWIALETTPKPKSPILSVPLNILNPSGARKITSPPTSWIVSPSKQPISLVIGCSWKSEIVLPTNLKILLSVKIINCSLNTARPVIVAPTLIEPEPFAAVKSVSV